MNDFAELTFWIICLCTYRVIKNTKATFLYKYHFEIPLKFPTFYFMEAGDATPPTGPTVLKISVKSIK